MIVFEASRETIGKRSVVVQDYCMEEYYKQSDRLPGLSWENSILDIRVLLVNLLVFWNRVA